MLTASGCIASMKGGPEAQPATSITAPRHGSTKGFRMQDLQMEELTTIIGRD
jgi:hypothetical protein